VRLQRFIFKNNKLQEDQLSLIIDIAITLFCLSQLSISVFSKVIHRHKSFYAPFLHPSRIHLLAEVFSSPPFDFCVTLSNGRIPVKFIVTTLTNQPTSHQPNLVSDSYLCVLRTSYNNYKLNSKSFSILIYYHSDMRIYNVIANPINLSITQFQCIKTFNLTSVNNFS